MTQAGLPWGLTPDPLNFTRSAVMCTPVLRHSASLPLYEYQPVRQVAAWARKRNVCTSSHWNSSAAEGAA